MRNREPILQILKKHIDTQSKGVLLEISSGSGCHIEFFAPHFPQLVFQPSEYEQRYLTSIATSKNILSPLLIDVRRPVATWGLPFGGNVNYMLNINMIHITEYACTEGLFKAAGELLKIGGLLITYGPYAENGVLTPDSNIRFDAGLRAENPAWGVRDIADLRKLAEQYSIYLKDKYEMPANNKTLIWQKEETISVWISRLFSLYLGSLEEISLTTIS